MTKSLSQKHAPHIVAFMAMGGYAAIKSHTSLYDDEVIQTSGLGSAKRSGFIGFVDGSEIRIQPDRHQVTVWGKATCKELPQLLETIVYWS